MDDLDEVTWTTLNTNAHKHTCKDIDFIPIIHVKPRYMHVDTRQEMYFSLAPWNLITSLII